LLLSGQTEEAVNVLRDATRLLPVEPAAFTELADAAERLGHDAEAREALVQHISLADDDRRIVASASRIADLSMRLNEPASAVRWLSRATLLKSDPMFFARLSEAHLAAGDVAAARRALDRALALGAPAATPLIEKLSTALKNRVG
jgi:Flp pilus assembly protein TadD